MSVAINVVMTIRLVFANSVNIVTNIQYHGIITTQGAVRRKKQAYDKQILKNSLMLSAIVKLLHMYHAHFNFMINVNHSSHL